MGKPCQPGALRKLRPRGSSNCERHLVVQLPFLYATHYSRSSRFRVQIPVNVSSNFPHKHRLDTRQQAVGLKPISESSENKNSTQADRPQHSTRFRDYGDRYVVEEIRSGTTTTKSDHGCRDTHITRINRRAQEVCDGKWVHER